MSDNISDAPPSGVVATPNQILIATFLGSPLAGYFLAAQNQEVFGRPERFRPTIVAGIIATAIVASIGALLPFTLIHLAVAAGVAFFVYNSIGNSQRRDLNQHFSSFGQGRSVGYVFVVTVVGASANAAAFFFLFFFLGTVKAILLPA